MEALEAAFAEVDGGSGAPQMKQAAPKETIMTNIDPHAGKKGGAAAAKKKAPHQISKYDEEDQEDESEQAMRGNNDGPNSKMQRSPVKVQKINP